jgi:hypothetical protein
MTPQDFIRLLALTLERAKAHAPPLYGTRLVKPFALGMGVLFPASAG